MNSKPTLRQLEYAVALAEDLHFGRAARRCGVSQPGLSAQLRELEELLGVALFERTSRRVLLTPDGEELIAHVRRVLRATDDLLEVAEVRQDPGSGILRLGVIPTMAPYLLPGVLRRLREGHPRLQVLLREDQTDRLVGQLRDGQLDLLLLALPVEAAEMESLPLFEEPFVLLAPEGHPLASDGPVREADLRGQAVLLLEDGHCLRDQALSVCDVAGAREVQSLRATSMSTLVQMVANGVGVTLLPATAVPIEVRPGHGLVARSFAPPAPSRQVGLLWRRSSPRSELYRRVGDVVTGCVAPVAQAGHNPPSWPMTRA